MTKPLSIFVPLSNDKKAQKERNAAFFALFFIKILRGFGGHEREIVNWTMNDYVGMSVDTDVVAAFVSAAQNDGVGSGGTRNISGTTTRHILLEKTIADLHQKEAALIFTSAYVANSTAISILGRAFPDTIIFQMKKIMLR
ncbi:MAG: aminotransferase class I/II-fold pyridoxal phosphate-dependent enzyme [Saprospiraceae bacterium]|nr:aminotransferase class I/II-fold pyridoxal phosphate-dependent enzyme [Saprospiraceae bacterium]